MMDAPQIIYLVFMCIGLLAEAGLHGKTKEITYCFPVYFVKTMITVGLLFWGGFFGG